MISEIISEILNDLGNYFLGSPFSAFVSFESSNYDLIFDNKYLNTWTTVKLIQRRTASEVNPVCSVK